MTSDSAPQADADVIRYYDGYDEAGRLTNRPSLELVRTQELLLRHLPAGPLRIVDVGGAAGVYSFWLAEQGHEVHLRDLTPKHIEQARERAATATHPLASVEVADGRRLDLPSDWVDVVLEMGPLYHLTEREDRLQALAEARRVLKPGGLLFAAAISRFASLLDGYWSGFMDDPAFASIVRRDLATGAHHNPTGDPQYFTTAFFHRPEELEAEAREAGFDDATCYAVESFGPCLPDLGVIWADRERQSRLLEMIRTVETEPALRGVSPHLLAVGRKG